MCNVSSHHCKLSSLATSRVWQVDVLNIDVDRDVSPHQHFAPTMNGRLTKEGGLRHAQYVHPPQTSIHPLASYRVWQVDVVNSTSLTAQGSL